MVHHQEQELPSALRSDVDPINGTELNAWMNIDSLTRTADSLSMSTPKDSAFTAPSTGANTGPDPSPPMPSETSLQINPDRNSGCGSLYFQLPLNLGEADRFLDSLKLIPPRPEVTLSPLSASAETRDESTASPNEELSSPPDFEEADRFLASLGFIPPRPEATLSHPLSACAETRDESTAPPNEELSSPPDFEEADRFLDSLGDESTVLPNKERSPLDLDEEDFHSKPSPMPQDEPIDAAQEQAKDDTIDMILYPMMAESISHPSLEVCWQGEPGGAGDTVPSLGQPVDVETYAGVGQEQAKIDAFDRILDAIMAESVSSPSPAAGLLPLFAELGDAIPYFGPRYARSSD
ncbi:hypothetical protein V8E54_000868 [Elaphomyces granulatus]